MDHPRLGLGDDISNGGGIYDWVMGGLHWGFEDLGGVVINGLDLFSGIGGLSIALQDWVRPIAYCESDRYCQAVLLSRMRSGDISIAPIWDDVCSLNSEIRSQSIDIIFGGFPCQDISTAGTGKGLGGKRSGLYWELYRLAEEIRPDYIFLENVPAIRTRGLCQVVRSLSYLRYDCRWTSVSAAEVGAPHLRKRWFLLAHTSGQRIRQDFRTIQGKQNQTNEIRGHGVVDSSSDVAHPDKQRAQVPAQGELTTKQMPQCASWWETEPSVGRVVDGLPFRVDRIKGLGNAVVPAQAKEAFKRLMGVL